MPRDDGSGESDTIGTWCNTQRTQKKKGNLSKERIEQLDAIGFDWGTERTETADEAWDRMITQDE